MDWQKIMEKIMDCYQSRRGSLNGAAAGFVIGVLIILIGLFKAIFIAACVIIGYLAGKKMEKDKEYFKNLLDRILPPGTYR